MRRLTLVTALLAILHAAPVLNGCTAQEGEQAEGASVEAEAAAKEAATPEENPLLNPRSPVMNQKAPDVFKAKFETSKGDFVIEVHRDWSPRGADRFYNLVGAGFFDECRFFRVLSGFMAQFGINGDPEVSAIWRNQQIRDDPVKQSNTRGFVTYAKSGAPHSRSTQIFINYTNNAQLDGQGFSPFGQIIEGMEVVDELHSGYGEGAPRGQGPAQAYIQQHGNAYLQDSFPDLDYIKKASVVE
jgi:peptidyl-prolyl cis-trans isomerase A (cyclophilin A)